MATQNEKEIFEPYLNQQYRLHHAVTYGQKLEVIRLLVDETKNGIVPIEGGQRIKLNPDSAAVKAVREGRAVAVDGKKVVAQRDGIPLKGVLGIAMIVLPILLVIGYFLFGMGGDEVEETVIASAPTVEVEIIEVEPTPEPSATPTQEMEPEIIITPVPTMTPEPTFTPVPVVISEYEVEVSENASVADFHQPIALRIAGEEMRISTARYGAEWNPAGVEWWPKTDVRKVLAVPYQESLLDAVFNRIDQPITIRLRNGAAIRYQINDITRVNTYEIEHMLSNVPSVAIILYGEEGENRWMIEGSAIQEEIEVEESQILEEITFLSIDSCSREMMKIECILTIDEADIGSLESLVLTDLDWWEGGSYPFSEVRSVLCSDEVCNVVLAGVTRLEGTTVIIYTEGDRATIQEVQPSTN